MRCLDCKYSDQLVRDNHGKLHCICSCKESDEFLKEIEIAFDGCGCGQEDDDAEY